MNKFIAFQNGNFDRISRQDAWGVADHLEKEGLADWQVKQAQNAVCLYIEGYGGKKIIADFDRDNDIKPIFLSVESWTDA